MGFDDLESGGAEVGMAAAVAEPAITLVESSVIETVDQILNDAVEANASDIHLEPNSCSLNFLRLLFPSGIIRCQ